MVFAAQRIGIQQINHSFLRSTRDQVSSAPSKEYRAARAQIQIFLV